MHYLQVERDRDTALVPDLELVEDLGRAWVAWSAPAFGEVIRHQNIPGCVVPALGRALGEGAEDNRAFVGASITEPIPIPELRCIGSDRKPTIDAKMKRHGFPLLHSTPET